MFIVQSVNVGCSHKLVHCISRAHGLCTSKITYHIGRVLSQVNHILRLGAKQGVSSDIFHAEREKTVILATRAAWQTTPAVRKACC